MDLDRGPQLTCHVMHAWVLDSSQLDMRVRVPVQVTV